MMNLRYSRGFTLIELLMVIAIIGILSTLVVSKVGNLKRDSAEKVSCANQAALERALDSYLTVHGRVNRLDSLMCYETGLGDGSGFKSALTNQYGRMGGKYVYCGPQLPAALTEAEAEKNAGLTPGLRGVLVPYSISRSEAYCLTDMLGLRFVMTHYLDATQSPRTRYTGNVPLGDGTYLPDEVDLGWDPMRSACIAQAVTNGTYLAAIPPFTSAGRAIYRACGQELFETRENGVYHETESIAEANATGGILFAFGLGESCSAVGKGQAGLEAAPTAEYPLRKFYRNYIVLFRLKSGAKNALPEFAGVIDPCGRTLSASRAATRNK